MFLAVCTDVVYNAQMTIIGSVTQRSLAGGGSLTIAFVYPGDQSLRRGDPPGNDVRLVRNNNRWVTEQMVRGMK